MKIFLFAVLKTSLLNIIIPLHYTMRKAMPIPKRGYLLNCCALSGSRGFSLIEIVVFMVVASIIIGGVLFPFVMGVRDFEKPDEVLRAVLLAQSVMERYTHMDFFDRCLTPGSITAITDTDIILPEGYSGTKTIQYIDPKDTNLNISISPTDYKKIEVVITTPSLRTVSLQGIVSNWSYDALMI